MWRHIEKRNLPFSETSRFFCPLNLILSNVNLSYHKIFWLGWWNKKFMNSSNSSNLAQHLCDIKLISASCWFPVKINLYERVYILYVGKGVQRLWWSRKLFCFENFNKTLCLREPKVPKLKLKFWNTNSMSWSFNLIKSWKKNIHTHVFNITIEWLYSSYINFDWGFELLYFKCDSKN